MNYKRVAARAGCVRGPGGRQTTRAAAARGGMAPQEEPVRFPTPCGLTLAGVLTSPQQPSQSKAAVILLHGYANDKVQAGQQRHPRSALCCAWHARSSLAPTRVPMAWVGTGLVILGAPAIAIPPSPRTTSTTDPCQPPWLPRACTPCALMRAATASRRAPSSLATTWKRWRTLVGPGGVLATAPGAQSPPAPPPAGGGGGADGVGRGRVLS